MPSKSQPVKQAHRILSGRGSQQYLLEPPRESDSEFESNPVVEEFDDPSDDDYICPESVEHDENEDPDEDLDEELPKEIPSLKRKSSEKGLSQSKKHRGHTQSSQSGAVLQEQSSQPQSLPHPHPRPRQRQRVAPSKPSRTLSDGAVDGMPSQSMSEGMRSLQKPIRSDSQRQLASERAPPAETWQVREIPQADRVQILSSSQHISSSQREPLFVQSSPPPNTVRPTHIDEEEINRQLDLAARRFYLVHLSKHDTVLVIKHVMPWITMSDTLYRRARRKLQVLFKTWKNRVLRDAESWFQQWAQQNPYLATETSFKTLKDTLNKRFQVHWLPKVFGFAREAVDFEQCTKNGKLWLKYAFIQLVIRAHLSNRRKFNVADPNLAKHDRCNLLGAYDGLGKKSEFRNLTEEDFPLLAAKPHRVTSTFCLDLDNESDGSVGGDFDDDDNANSAEPSE